MDNIREGGCLCGAARYTIDLTDSETGNCHCRDCQKQSGAAFATVTTVQRAQIFWIKKPTGKIAASDRATRYFCCQCGTPLQWCGRDYPDISTINTATLDDTSGLSVTYEIFTRSRMEGILPVAGAAQSSDGYADLVWPGDPATPE